MLIILIVRTISKDQCNYKYKRLLFLLLYFSGKIITVGAWSNYDAHCPLRRSELHGNKDISSMIFFSTNELSFVMRMPSIHMHVIVGLHRWLRRLFFDWIKMNKQKYQKDSSGDGNDHNINNKKYFIQYFRVFAVRNDVRLRVVIRRKFFNAHSPVVAIVCHVVFVCDAFTPDTTTDRVNASGYFLLSLGISIQNTTDDGHWYGTICQG